METYYICRKDGTLHVTFEGNYCEALDFAAQAFDVPEGEYVDDYADVLTEEEFNAEYGDGDECDAA